MNPEFRIPNPELVCGTCYLERLRRELLIVALLVLALRVPFLNQAIQGDDIYYLYGAEHAQIDPLHPTHTRYAFLGRMVDMAGHPHPPLDAWYLGLLLGIFKDISEVRFHAAYILFSLIAAYGALSLARRFSPHPLLATLLFLVTPAFVVNGGSLEADVPFVAFWLLATALYVDAVDRESPRLLIASSCAMLLAGLAAYQAVILAPILLLYGRKWRPAWIAALTAPAVIVVWQLYERFTSGALPAGVLAGYMQSYGFQAPVQKLKNAVALTGHLAWLVFPALWLPPVWLIPVAVGAAVYDTNPLFWGSVTVGVGILIWCARHWRDFLAQWVLIFFAGALILFFAGSARYLLPIALPVAILATRIASRRWLKVGIGCSLALSVLLAVVNYQHWNAYRQFARSLEGAAESKRVWINGEWGLRYYFESEGGLPLVEGQPLEAGDVLVSGSLGYPRNVTAGGMLVPTASRTVTSRIPLRLVALEGRSAYSTTMFGLRPFDVSLNTIDQLRAVSLVARAPTLADLPMNAPEAEQQIVSGIYQLEDGRYRWMSQVGLILLKPPAEASPLVVRLFIPDVAPARRITVEVNGSRVGEETYPKPGSYTIATPPLKAEGASAVVKIAVDRTFSVAGDQRQLGVILVEAGFRAP